MAARFIRVKDKTTGHELDVREDSHLLERGLVQHVKPVRYPPSRYPRPTKYSLTVQTAAQGDAATDGVAEDSNDTTEE